ncbi:MAG TPA: chemotaxis protein CheW [Thermodesulfobacteriota bacterium]
MIKKFVTLGLGASRYAVEVSKVREILARFEVAPLPKTPAYIEGIISLRGEIIPVVDLRVRFELPAKVRDEETRIIVVELPDCQVGIKVDRVFEVLKLDEAAIEPPPPLVAGLKADYLEGVCEVQGRLVTILRLDAILSTTERIQLAEEVAAAQATL